MQDGAVTVVPGRQRIFQLIYTHSSSSWFVRRLQALYIQGLHPHAYLTTESYHVDSLTLVIADLARA